MREPHFDFLIAISEQFDQLADVHEIGSFAFESCLRWGVLQTSRRRHR
jgi:hypothetical protein